MKEKCYVCGNIIEESITDSLRENTCPICGASRRNRDLAKVIVDTFTGNDLSLSEIVEQLKDLNIYDTQSSGPIHNILKVLPNYIFSEYFDNISVGSIHNGIRCEDIQKLTFSDNTFDLVITQDIIEHTSNPDKAFLEIDRVLKPDGIHIFTVPIHENRKTIKRAKIDDQGNLVNLLSPVYHEDPLRTEGTLVYTDFGDDLIDFLKYNNISTEIVCHHKFYDIDEISNLNNEKEYEYYNQCRKEKNLLKFFRYNSIVFRSKKSKSMKNSNITFTGERFIPWMDGAQIHYEHLHRYMFASQFVKGKKVLDLACGEGYGSNILSKYAECVTGIDIDKDTVEHAYNRYTKQNLEFIQGSILDIPIEGKEKFDVITCFEGIEHVEDHEKLLSEVKRLLKEDGLFIVSSPNKKTYSDDPDFNNPFHKKELYFSDFRHLLGTYFRHSIFLGQKVYNTSNIWPLRPYDHYDYKEFVIEKVDKEFCLSDIDKKVPLYFIAIASNKKLDEEYHCVSNLLDISNVLTRDLERHIGELEKDRQSKDVKIIELEKDRQSKDVKIIELENNIQSKDVKIIELENNIQSKDVKIIELENNIQSKDVKIIELENKDVKIIELENNIQDIQQSVIWNLTLYFHNKVIERLLPHNTRRRVAYDRILKSCRIIINEGFGSFKLKFKEYIDSDRKQKRDILCNIEEPKIQIEHNLELMKDRLLDFLFKQNDNLSFPQFEEPIVSIIILTFNKAEFTYQCVESILRHTDVAYELIIVDNGSSDYTNSLFKLLDNVTIIKNKENVGFVRGCNQGANKSKGRYVLFLNNDVVVTHEWLSRLVSTIENYPKCGAVGCKLVWPNGKLQEAGSIIWRDGSALGYGRGDDPLKPEYSYIREVDYCSAACLLVKKNLFQELGGFDEQFAPAYYEDSDLCLGIWNLGYKVIFQSNVILYHHEFTSSSMDKAVILMETNKSKFVTKNKDILKEKMILSPYTILSERDKRQRNKILILDDRIPTPDQGSGFPRAYHMLKFLAEFGYKITLFPLDKTTPWQPYTNELQQLGVEVFYGDNLDFIKFAENRRNFYDLVLVSRSHNMKKTIKHIKNFFPNAILIYDAEAIVTIREMLKTKTKGIKIKEEYFDKMMLEEIDLMKKADIKIIVSEKEKDIILQKEKLDNVYVWGHPIGVNSVKNKFSDRKDILFVGGFLLNPGSPNEDAILYFAKEIFPKIQKKLSCRLIIVGIDPTESVKKLSSSSIVVTGYVENIEEYYEKCRVFIVPHRYAAGISWKLQEAMSYGIPSVVSELIASQLNLKDNEEVLIAKDSKEYVQKIVELYQNGDTWNSIQKNAIEYIQRDCDPTKLKKRLNDILEMATNVDQKDNISMSRRV